MESTQSQSSHQLNRCESVALARSHVTCEQVLIAKRDNLVSPATAPGRDAFGDTASQAAAGIRASPSQNSSPT